MTVFVSYVAVCGQRICLGALVENPVPYVLHDALHTKLVVAPQPAGLWRQAC